MESPATPSAAKAGLMQFNFADRLKAVPFKALCSKAVPLKAFVALRRSTQFDLP